MKTAISIPDDLFKRVENFAAELHLSRSQVFTDAVREYIERRRNEKILDAINRGYSDVETEEEKRLREESKKHYAGLLKDEKW